MNADKTKIIWTAGAVLVIVGIIAWFAGDGLGSYFIQDDMMNLFEAWFRPLDSQRPITVVFYDAIFAWAGLNPLPYHMALYAVLGVNLLLLYWFCVRLSGSRAVGALACLLGAYHAHLADVYYSADTAGDLLCALFYFGAFVYYARVRERGEPRLGQLVLVLLLYVCALNAKEMAVSLPVLVLVYECVYYKRGARSFRAFGMLALATLVDVLHLFFGAGRKVQVEAYNPHPSWAKLMESWAHYLFDLFYGAVKWTPWKVAALWIVLAAAAWLLKRRELWIALALIFVGILPIAFIAERGFYAYYMVLPGWCLFLAVLLAAIPVRPALTFAILAALLIPLHRREKPKGMAWVAAESSRVRTVVAHVDEAAGPLPRGARVLFLSDPFEKDDWILTFMFRLHYRDDDIRVDRAQWMKTPPGWSDYDRVLRIDGTALTTVASKASSAPAKK